MVSDSYAASKTNYLRFSTKFCYGVGHIFNDLCSSMWFSYVLVFFERVLLFSPTKAGLVLLVGQLADGFSTPMVGIFSDKENKIVACARYGRRKIWHLIGTSCVLMSFPFIFSKCVGCQYATDAVQLAYYCAFVILFQFGWASVQISHLALIPELTPKKHDRTELNSIRYAFMVFANLSVYAVAFLFLETGKEDDSSPPSNSTGSYNGTTFEPTTEAGKIPSYSICPDDASDFRNMALFCICAGTLFSTIFHIGVKEPEYKDPKKIISSEGLETDLKLSSCCPRNRMRKSDWFREHAFYQVAVLYLATRLYTNLYQVYIPLYVQDTLKLDKTAIATVPFVMYFAGFISSVVMKPVNKKLGRKGAFSIGCTIGLIACIGVAFGNSEAFRIWGVYCIAAMLGFAGSTQLITSLSVTADLIGNNVEGGAFVYGIMSFGDKVCNGVVIMIIQQASNESDVFYQHVITYGCGAACILGMLVTLSLIPIKIGHRRGLAKRLASLIVEEDEKDTILRYPRLEDGTNVPSLVEDTNNTNSKFVSTVKNKEINSCSDIF